MARYIKEPTAYDPRSGFKVKLDEMVEDGEVPGLFVHKDEADEINMQRFPVHFEPENTNRRAFPPAERNDITMRVGQLYRGEDNFSFIELVPGVAQSGNAEAYLTTSQVVVYLGLNVEYRGSQVLYTVQEN